MPSEIRFSKLNAEDLASPESFRIWIKKNLKNVYLNKEIPNEHLLIFLGYVNTLIFNDRSLDRNSWLSLIRDMESRLKSLKNME